jgi:hypothetical protein
MTWNLNLDNIFVYLKDKKRICKFYKFRNELLQEVNKRAIFIQLFYRENSMIKNNIQFKR